MATHQCAHFASARENHGIFLRSSAEVIRNQGQILASTLRCQIPTRHTRSKVSCPYLAARNPAVRSSPTIGRSRGCRRTAASARSGHLLPAKPPVGEAPTQDVPAQFRCAPPKQSSFLPPFNARFGWRTDIHVDLLKRFANLRTPRCTKLGSSPHYFMVHLFCRTLKVDKFQNQLARLVAAILESPLPQF